MYKLIISSLIILIITSCASVPSNNHWSVSDTNFNNRFPKNNYIAMQGRGETLEIAQNNALKEISMYFNSQVSAESRVFQQTIEKNQKEQYKFQYDNEVIVSSQMQLFGVRYANDAFYDKRARLYNTVAYIEINEAWKLFESVFNEKYNEINRLYNDAKTEEIDFMRFIKITKTQNYLQTPEFQNSFIFGQVLFNNRMKDKTTDIYSIFNELTRLKSTVSNISIAISNDFENILQKSVSDELRTLGLNIAASASTICNIAVDLNESKADIGTMYYPSINFQFIAENNIILQFSIKAERDGAVNPNVALRRAFKSIENSIKRDFINQILLTM